MYKIIKLGIIWLMAITITSILIMSCFKHFKKYNSKTMATGNYKNYASKKAAQSGGSYEGTSPFFRNIPEFQYLKPLHKDSYPHLRQWPKFRLPSPPRLGEPQKQKEEEHEHEI